MKKYYLLLVVCGAALFFGATYYKLSPPLFVIKQYNLSYEQKSLKELNNREVETFDSILRARGINYRSADDDIIYDSLLNQKLISGKKELFDIKEVEYFRKTKKDSTIIVKNSKGVDFIREIFNARSQTDIPKQYQKHISKNSYDIVLYFTEKDLPIDIAGNEVKDRRRYFIATDDYKHYLLLIKVNELFTAEELIDKGFLFDNTKISIPEDILYPYRDDRFWILPIMLLLALFPMLSTLKPKEDAGNLNRLLGLTEVLDKQINVAKIWLLLAILCIVAVCAVVFFEMDIAEGGGAIIFIGSFLALTSIIVFFYYRKRARQLSQILSGEDVLAKWEYDRFFWQKYADKYLQKYLAMNKSTLLLVSVMIIIIFGAIMIADPEVAETMGLIGAGLIALVTLVAYISPKISAKNLAKSHPIAIIGKNCVLIGRQFHSWGMFGNRLENVKISEEEINTLEIQYSYQTRYGRTNVSVIIPIPQGKIEEAQAVARRLMEEKR